MHPQPWLSDEKIIYHWYMRREAEVKNLLKESEAKTGNRAPFIVGPSQKVGCVMITVVSNDGADHTMESDLQDGCTPANAKRILDWFEPLAAANTEGR